MPVRVHMLTGRSVTAGGGGSVLAALVLGVIVLVVLAVVLLPLALILAGVSLVAFGIYRVNRWMQGLGAGRSSGQVGAKDVADFDSLRAKLQELGRVESVSNDAAQTDSPDAVDADGEGRRNVRVVGSRQ